MKRSLAMMCAAAMVVGLLAWRASAWHEKEHFAVTALAGRLLPTEVPAFFRNGVADASAHCSIDPDLFKNKATPQLTHAEHPEHFFDAEFFAGVELPPMRYDYYKRCYERGLDPHEVGTLPWALAEWTGRLTLAFAEHRARPDDPRIRQKCLVYAGLLAHYAGDLCQPLHTTVHWDGRVAEPGDRSPRSGVHAKVDGLFRRLDVDAATVTSGQTAAAFDDPWVGIIAEFARSNARVDRVYELESRLPGYDTDEAITDPEVRDFALDRMRASVRFIASLYLTAWEDSADVAIPDWLNRDALRVE